MYFRHNILKYLPLIIISFCLSEALFSAPGATSSRRANISKEGVTKSKKGDKTKLDFDATDIDGQRKLPMGSVLNNSQADKNYDFIRVRLRWHPEMVQSASSIDSGRSLK